MGGCHAGDVQGSKTCDQTSRCRPPLVCVAGACVLPDGAVDTGSTDTFSDAGGDLPSDAAVPMNKDVGYDGAGSDGAPQDTALDAGDDTPHGSTTDAGQDAPDDGTSDASEDVSDGAASDASDDGEDTGAHDGSMPDGISMDASWADASSGPDGRGEPDRGAVLHVFATTDNGGLWLLSATISSLHGPVGYIGRTTDVRAKAGSIGPVDDVDAQSIENEVNALARQGSDVFTTRVVDQSWTPWAKIASGVSAMSLANVTGQLWACLAGTDGRLRLMSRQSGGWQDLGDVMEEASLPSGVGEAPAAIAKLDCVGVGGDLEILALDPNGGLWHATKTRTRWVQFRRIPDASGRGLRDIDVSNSLGEVHVLGTSQTTQYHGTLNADGAWSGFGDIENYIPFSPPEDILAGAQAAILAEVDWLRVTTFGEIWLSPRFRNQLNGFERFIERAPDDARFVTASATSVLP